MRDVCRVFNIYKLWHFKLCGRFCLLYFNGSARTVFLLSKKKKESDNRNRNIITIYLISTTDLKGLTFDVKVRAFEDKLSKPKFAWLTLIPLQCFNNHKKDENIFQQDVYDVKILDLRCDVLKTKWLKSLILCSEILTSTEIRCILADAGAQLGSDRTGKSSSISMISSRPSSSLQEHDT